MILNEEFDKLYNYKEFDLGKFLGKKIFIKLAKCGRKLLTYIIDNAIWLEEENRGKKRLLNYVIKYCSFKIIKILLAKNVNLEYMDTREHTPASYCKHSRIGTQ